MSLLEGFRIAFRSLMANKLRSMLTTLGVVIGIFAVVTLVSIGEAGKVFVYNEVTKFGTGSNYMEVQPGKETDLTAMMSLFDSTLTEEDSREIAKLKYVSQAVGYIIRRAKIKFGRNSYQTPYLMGTNFNLPQVISHKTVAGSFFSKADEEGKRKFAVIGPSVAKELFGPFSPVGEKVKVNGVRFTVIGLLEEKGYFMGMDYDSVVYIPLSVAKDMFDTRKLMTISVTADNETHLPVVVAEIKSLLINRHDKEDFKVMTQTDALKLLDSIMSVLTAMIGGIAAISLLVGGIGIMNIMLVSVIERTAEIGIRKSLGARKMDILYQFLAESILISVAGGVIGICFGTLVSIAIMKVIRIPVIVATWAATLAFVVAIVVGIASGLYPSMRAARMDPVEALRYE